MRPSSEPVDLGVAGLTAGQEGVGVEQETASASPVVALGGGLPTGDGAWFEDLASWMRK